MAEHKLKVVEVSVIAVIVSVSLLLLFRLLF